MTKLLRLVAWLEVLSGLLMIATLAIQLLSKGEVARDLNNGALIILGTLGLACGIGLLRSSAFAWRGSVALQLLQTPVFWIGSVLYRPGLGLFIPLGFNLNSTGTSSSVNEVSLGVDFMVSLGASGGQQYVAVNIAALVCLAMLLLNQPPARASTRS